MRNSQRSIRPDDMGGPTSPDARRRRYDSAPYTPSLQRPSIAAPQLYPRTDRRASLPRPDFMSRPFDMANPPRTHSVAPAAQDHSMILPPLQTPLRDPAKQAKAVEAMVMSIPSLNKIRVLAKISPPLPWPGPTSPPFATRGALIALEGTDDAARQLVVAHLTEVLERDGEYKVRVFAGAQAFPPSSRAAATTDAYPEWLGLIRAYHAESEEMKKYITTIPATKETAAVESEPQPSSGPVSPDLRAVDEASRRDGEYAEQEKQRQRSEDAMDVDKPAPATAGVAATAAVRPIPVAIVCKYQLTLTDTAASTLPIADEYSPTDHWQWMATLWRGIVGPDATIVVRGPTPPEHGSGQGEGAGAGNGNGSGVRTSPRANADNPVDRDREKQATGSSLSSQAAGLSLASSAAQAQGMLPVEVKLAEARAVILRGEGKGRVSESGLRRVGFEIGEFLRGTGERSGR